jgi:AAA domain
MSIQPPSVLLMGASGSGKTYSLHTLIEAGLEVFLFVTEPHGLETLLDVVASKNLPLEKLHWRYIQPSRPGFKVHQKLAELISVSNQQTLSSMPPTQRENPAFVELMKAFNDFTDEKDGKSYGPANLFDASRAVVIDSLSGISSMAMDMVIGDKVTAGPGEWGMAMRALERFILTCTSDLKCFFIMTAHIEKEVDELSGGTRTMVSTLGKKLAPSIPKYFSEVVLSDSETTGDNRKHIWSTNTPNVVLKNRSLPIGSKLEPSFKPIVEAFNKRLAMIKDSKVA